MLARLAGQGGPGQARSTATLGSRHTVPKLREIAWRFPLSVTFLNLHPESLAEMNTLPR